MLFTGYFKSFLFRANDLALEKNMSIGVKRPICFTGRNHPNMMISEEHDFLVILENPLPSGNLT